MSYNATNDLCILRVCVCVYMDVYARQSQLNALAVLLQITLFLHTFKPESRGLTSEDYQLYNKCAPCEIYHSRLGDSNYFHHFVGKNFLYTAVVAFRK